MNAPAPSLRSFRVSARFAVAFYLCLFLLLQWKLGIAWKDLSLVTRVTELDSHALRYYVVHEDTPAAKLTTTVEHDAIHLRGSGFRGSGLGVILRAASLFIETDCPVEQPHVHSRFTERERLVVAFDAKAEAGPQAVVASASNGAGFLYSPHVELGPNWRSVRIPIDDMGPGGTAFAEISSGIPYLMLTFFPPHAVDVRFRDLRVLRVPQSELRTSEYQAVQP